MEHSRFNHLVSLVNAGKAYFEVIPGQDGHKCFHFSISTFKRSTYPLKDKNKSKMDLPWHQRAQRQRLLYFVSVSGEQ